MSERDVQMLTDNIQMVRERIAAAARQAGRAPDEITLVAATKTQSSQTIRAAIAAGITVCGENRVQEMTAHLDDNAYENAGLHFIGHLQTNKVKDVVGRVDLIESVDSPRLLEAIARQAEKLGLVQEILLEVNIAGEASKSGISPEELPALARQAAQNPHVRLRGLMAIPPAPRVEGGNRVFFSQMRQLLIDMGNSLAYSRSALNCLSMGMSRDYEDAVREGATLVRVGTLLFGPRPTL